MSIDLPNPIMWSVRVTLVKPHLTHTLMLGVIVICFDDRVHSHTLHQHKKHGTYSTYIHMKHRHSMCRIYTVIV